MKNLEEKLITVRDGEGNEEQLLPLTSDIVFKRMFSRPGTEDILKDFIEAITGMKIKSVVVENPELPKNIYDEKAGILDIKAKLDDGTICDIEMQVEDEHNIDKRSLYYISNLIDTQLKPNDKYEKLKKVIAINILNFNFYKTNTYHNTARMIFEKADENTYVDMGYTKEDKYATEDVEMHILELPKFKKKNPGAATEIERWLWLISGEWGKLKMSEEGYEKIKKAVDEVKKLSQNKEEWNLYVSRQRMLMDIESGKAYEREQGIAEGIKEGRKKGIAEGKAQGKKERN